jgi:hypothetical protein
MPTVFTSAPGDIPYFIWHRKFDGQQQMITIKVRGVQEVNNWGVIWWDD